MIIFLQTPMNLLWVNISFLDFCIYQKKWTFSDIFRGSRKVALTEYAHMDRMDLRAITYIAYSLHRQFSGFQSSTSLLKAFIVVIFFISRGIVLQIWWPRYEKISVSWKTLQNLSKTSSGELHKSQTWFCFSKTLLTIGAGKFFSTLNVFVMSFWRFFTWI